MVASCTACAVALEQVLHGVDAAVTGRHQPIPEKQPKTSLVSIGYTTVSLAAASHTSCPCLLECVPVSSKCAQPMSVLACADEIDAIGTKRYDSHSGGEREIQRTMLELLNQMDGFDALSEVKVRGGGAAGLLGAWGEAVTQKEGLRNGSLEAWRRQLRRLISDLTITMFAGAV